jgi:hypothetical protein
MARRELLERQHGFTFGEKTDNPPGEQQLMDALATLEVERNYLLEQLRHFERRRIREKLRGRRQPSREAMMTLRNNRIQHKST